MPDDVHPARLADFAIPANANNALTHFVAVSMDRSGRPFRLFTTNRWVTGEVWYAADDVIRMQDRFAVDGATPARTANAWITALLRLFQPQAAALLARRDAAVADWQAANPGVNAYEDRALEITSVSDIAVEDWIAAVDAARTAAAS